MASASHPFTNTPPSPPPLQQTVSSTTRRARSIISISTVFSVPNFYASSFTTISDFFFERQRLFTAIFNPTRLAIGEGSTLGALIFDIELVSLRNQ
ncbi:hypothetical protein NC652_035402 [Populus alba x Populus x berolinensis]|nr:hypothetical protein NC652_035402 [Populus alba x Populus x berolinensis]